MNNICFSDSKPGRPKPRTWFAALISAIALAGFTPGCVFVPTPHYYAAGSRQNVTEQSTNKIQPGVDTIEDVLLKLGEPDALSPDERTIAYGSTKIIGLLFSTVDSDGSDLPEVSQYHFLDVMLDDKGVVTNREFSKVGNYLDQVWTFPRAGTCVPLTGSIGGEEIKISSQATWFPDFDFSKPYPDRPVSGSLILTGSTLYFIEATQWLNGQPTLSLRYGSLTECRLGKNYLGWGPTLIVRTKDNHFYSFTFYGKATEPACRFIQGKIEPSQPEK